MMKKQPALADRIRAEIVRLGVTKYRVAKDTGLPESTVGRFMGGTSKTGKKLAGKDPTIQTAEILLDYIGWTTGPRSTKR